MGKNARTTSLGSRNAISKYLSQERMTGTDHELGNTHEINRQNTVKEILLYVFLMAKYGMVEPNMTVGAATTQYYSARADEKKQAAHCAPGQIKFRGVDIYEFIPDEDLSLELEMLFGAADGIPTIFNESDSVAEAKGLCEALVMACNDAAASGRFARFTFAGEIMPLLENSFRIYQAKGMDAFAKAVDSQKALMRLPTTLRPDYHKKKIEILTVYYQCLASADDSFGTAIMLHPQDVVKSFQTLNKKLSANG